MRTPTRMALTLALGGLAACGDASSISPVAPDGLSTPLTQTAAIEVCETITFDEFVHGDSITSVALPTLGLMLNVSVNPYKQPDGSDNPYNVAKAWDTNADPNVWLDDDLLWMQTAGEDGLCAACEGLGRLLVIEDAQGFVTHGDDHYGGEVTISGFEPGDYIKSYIAVDDDETEPDIRLVVDGDTVGSSTSMGNGLVETVTTQPHSITSSVAFYFGTLAVDETTGSGAIDGIEVCREEEDEKDSGGQGCTPGYWKQKQHFDSWEATGYSTSVLFGDVFAACNDASNTLQKPESGSVCGKTLLEALKLRGGGLNAMARHAVAALLNAAHPDVNYTTAPESAEEGDVIDMVNAALSSGDYGDTKDDLAELNEQGCSLN